MVPSRSLQVWMAQVSGQPQHQVTVLSQYTYWLVYLLDSFRPGELSLPGKNLYPNENKSFTLAKQDQVSILKPLWPLELRYLRKNLLVGMQVLVRGSKLQIKSRKGNRYNSDLSWITYMRQWRLHLQLMIVS